MAENREKTYVADVDRSIYDIRDVEHDAYRMESGLTSEIVDKLSKEKGDPVWMQQFRLQSLQIYNELRLPDWGPSLEGLDIDHIATYVRPNTKMQNDWANVPQDIKALSVWASRRRSASRSPAWARSTTPSWFTIMCATRSPPRA